MEIILKRPFPPVIDYTRSLLSASDSAAPPPEEGEDSPAHGPWARPRPAGRVDVNAFDEGVGWEFGWVFTWLPEPLPRATGQTPPGQPMAPGDTRGAHRVLTAA